MAEWLSARPEIAELYNLITFQMGSYVFVAVKARMAEADSVPAMIDGINRVQDELKERFEEVRWVFFEPDDKR